MGLKVLDLALCALKKKNAKLHTTGEEARVEVKYKDKNMVFFLHFDDGRVEEVLWSADLQGFCVGGDTLDSAEITPA